ncbi:hypothetical protein [Flavobacterium sp.]|uniref:hypothetical protein n=1 Tax=Flavobacterium sp. TaxID=239 RepID=UPI00262CFE09|nr:hypothetical protein [Flavobacterium sp.]
MQQEKVKQLCFSQSRVSFSGFELFEQDVPQRSDENLAYSIDAAGATVKVIK